MSIKQKSLDFGQRLGKAILLPIAILPVAGLLLGISSALSGAAVLQAYPVLNNTILQAILQIMNAAGSGVFSALPLIFAVGIAVGLVKGDKGTAGLAAVVGYFVLIITINALLKVTGGLPPEGTDPRAYGQGLQFGVMTLQMGVFGGILAGIGTAFVHNRFYKTSLPEFLAFFGGSRLVPIVNTFAFLIIGSLMFLIWPFIGHGIAAFGEFATGLGVFGSFLYGLTLRTLYLLGLHHVFYLPFWTTSAGGTLEVGGQVYQGFQTIFLAQLSDPSTTKFFENLALFNSGRYLHIMIGMPAVAFAMYKAIPAGPKRKATAGFLLSMGLTAFITGVTEPLSFALLFASPILFVIEAVLFASVFVVAALADITIGSTFSAGAIEFLLFGVFQGNDKTNYIWALLLGIPIAIAYFFIFKTAIIKLNAKTPGREDDGVTEEEKTSPSNYVTDSGKSEQIIAALGGMSNITDIDNCATRLRVSVKKGDVIDVNALKSTGAYNTIVRGTSVQVIFGPKVNLVRADIDEYIESIS
ncbi:PTS transporter subunit EIIC [Neobacillus niacini]|uniref:PTS transporter subunit EIIC n=1 Tax=Neobacillus niacini TaxID=86668 RepID=UPI0005ED6E5A|nr:PTS transporter subunit EIIC [Neobacillus niacini]